MKELKELMIKLAYVNIYAFISYDFENKECYLDLQTGAKSHLYVYESGTIRGRYNYTSQIDFKDEHILLFLCREFNNALCYRDYGNASWFVLCEKLGVETNTGY